MNIALWVLQGILAVIFLRAIFMKVSQTKDSLKEKCRNWVDDLSTFQVRIIGVFELLGSVGLITPALTGIFPVLIPLAAVGLVLS